MTTLKDLLYDFAGEVIKLEEGEQTTTLDVIVDEYIEIIKQRIIG